MFFKYVQIVPSFHLLLSSPFILPSLPPVSTNHKASAFRLRYDQNWNDVKQCLASVDRTLSVCQLYPKQKSNCVSIYLKDISKPWSLVFFVLIRFSECGREIPVKYPWLGLTGSAVIPSTGGQTGIEGQQEILCGGVLFRHAPG